MADEPVIVETTPPTHEQLYRWSRADAEYVLDRLESIADKFAQDPATVEQPAVETLEVPAPEREPEHEPEKPKVRRIV
jgi:hypothetical protein